MLTKYKGVIIMYCKNCGKEVNDNAKVCPECGVLLERLRSFESTDIFLIISFGLICLRNLFFGLLYSELGLEDVFEISFSLISLMFVIAACIFSIICFARSFREKKKSLKLITILNFIYVQSVFLITICQLDF